ncbi:hypothetical protein SAMN05216522_11748 [Rosenbergiella nectarea]|uniref:Uncharacterized protein n=1 Tax=Rosenbergiella nectarea TaxID=988801 RepID=A0A1H9MRM9_9GAMM|nr:hypothetical protein [Rosenbergiella nectarea]SER26137.1 hypothetical protein SAMN05216522_11748 [Rosenbergiella nectarea]
METWAKLFESNGRQVLVTKEYDDEDESHKLSVAIRIEGAQISLGPVIKCEDAEGVLDRVFNAFNQESADNFTQKLVGCETVYEAVKALNSGEDE